MPIRCFPHPIKGKAINAVRRPTSQPPRREGPVDLDLPPRLCGSGEGCLSAYMWAPESKQSPIEAFLPCFYESCVRTGPDRRMKPSSSPWPRAASPMNLRCLPNGNLPMAAHKATYMQRNLAGSVPRSFWRLLCIARMRSVLRWAAGQ